MNEIQSLHNISKKGVLLGRGAVVNLSETYPDLKMLNLHMFWSCNVVGLDLVDLDLSALLLTSERKMLGGVTMVWHKRMYDSCNDIATTYSEDAPEFLGQINSLSVVLAGENEEVLYNCDLSEELYNYTSMEVARLFRNEKGEWNYQPIGKGVGKDAIGLRDVIIKYNPFYDE